MEREREKGEGDGERERKEREKEREMEGWRELWQKIKTCKLYSQSLRCYRKKSVRGLCIKNSLVIFFGGGGERIERR